MLKFPACRQPEHPELCPLSANPKLTWTRALGHQALQTSHHLPLRCNAGQKQTGEPVCRFLAIPRSHALPWVGGPTARVRMTKQKSTPRAALATYAKGLANQEPLIGWYHILFLLIAPPSSLKTGERKKKLRNVWNQNKSVFLNEQNRTMP